MNINKFIKYTIIVFICAIMILAFPLKVFPKSTSIDRYNIGKENTSYILEVNQSMEQKFTPLGSKLKNLSIYLANAPSENMVLEIEVLQNEILIEEYFVEVQRGNTIINYEVDIPCKDAFTLLITNKGEEDLSVVQCLDNSGAIRYGIDITYESSVGIKEISYIWCMGAICLVYLFLKDKELDYRKKNFIVALCIIAATIVFYTQFKLQGILAGTFSWLFYALIFILVVGFLLIGNVTLRCKEWSIQGKFVISATTIGMVYLLLIPPYSVPDEFTHFLEANKIANQLMGMDGLDAEGYTQVRREDGIEYVLNHNVSTITNYYSEVLTKVSEEEQEYFGYGVGVQNLAWQSYIFPAIGIVIGRILNVNYVIMFTLGRMINLLLYIVLTSFSIRFIPFGKKVLYMIAHFPLCLFLAASFSYDSLNNCLAFFIFSYFLYLIYEKEDKSWKDFVILIVLAIIWLPIKYVYFPMFLLVFLIPRIWEKNKEKIIKYGLPVLVCSIFLLCFAMKERIIGVLRLDGSRLTSETLQFYNIQDFLCNPLGALDLYLNTIVNQFDKFLLGGIGNLGDTNLISPAWLSIGFLLLAILASMEKNKYVIQKKEKKIFFIITLLILSTTLASMIFSFTPQYFSEIRGVQSRYFIPIMPLMLLTVFSSKFKLDREFSDDLWVYGTYLLQIITICTFVLKLV